MLPCTAKSNRISNLFYAFESRQSEKKKTIHCEFKNTYDLVKCRKTELKEKKSGVKFQAPKCIRLRKHVLAPNCLPQYPPIRESNIWNIRTHAEQATCEIETVFFFYFFSVHFEESHLKLCSFAFLSDQTFGLSVQYRRHFNHFRITFRQGFWMFLKAEKEKKKLITNIYRKRERWQKKKEKRDGILKSVAQMTIARWLKKSYHAHCRSKFSILNSFDCMCVCVCAESFAISVRCYCVRHRMWTEEKKRPMPGMFVYFCVAVSVFCCVFIEIFHAKWQCWQRPMVPMAWKWRPLHTNSFHLLNFNSKMPIILIYCQNRFRSLFYSPPLHRNTLIECV